VLLALTQTVTLDTVRYLEITLEAMVVGAALRLAALGAKRRVLADVLRALALALFATTAAWITRQQIGNEATYWPDLVNLVASLLAITGFFLTELRR
jgi:TRAP-type uncharacterized transport system fused permease subunit